SARYDVDVTAAANLSVLRECQIVATCTSSKVAFVTDELVSPGTFIAAVGADNEHKQEIAPELLAASAVVADDLEQCATIGDLHHAITAGLMTRDSVRATLGEVIVGTKPGRTNDHEVIIFDSTGVAIEDVAAAAMVFERAERDGTGMVVA